MPEHSAQPPDTGIAEAAADHSPEPQVIIRSDGVTASERYLKSLCDRSFLSLWSYPGVFRDQGRENRKGDGKEVCDLLVVFDNHVIIFSDKHCEFKDSGNLEVDWSRWYKRAVLKSAEQVWGAERWIREFPGRLYLDRKCAVPFPLILPSQEKLIFHRIVVAHDASRRCREQLGGSGSLMFESAVVGDDHLTRPFIIGRVDGDKPFVHVFDDTTLDILLQTLDTVSDFVAYLTKKELLLASGTRVFATGEEELLAEYLARLNDDGEHDFLFPPNLGVLLTEGHWEKFLASPERKAQVEANFISYAWDDLIDTFLRHAMGGTQYWVSHHLLSEQERSFRWLARENRTRRRMLGGLLSSLIKDTPIDYRASRVIEPSLPGDPYYVFLLLPQLAGLSECEYRQGRRTMLAAYCKVLKLHRPDAQDVVGIATETGLSETRSEDLVYLDLREWRDEDAEEARELQRGLKIFQNTKVFMGKEQEYPVKQPQAHNDVHISRNSSCPCGSGKRFKRCCGAGFFNKRKD